MATGGVRRTAGRVVRVAGDSEQLSAIAMRWRYGGVKHAERGVARVGVGG